MPAFPPDAHQKGGRNAAPVHAEAAREFYASILPIVAELHRQGLSLRGIARELDKRGAELLRLDLAAAGIPYAVEGPDGPLYADFHALRHSYLTLLGKGGVDLRTQQELAGHSSPSLTARYSHVRLNDLAGAVERLPAFLPETSAPETQPQRLRATGTDAAPLATLAFPTPKKEQAGPARVLPEQHSGREAQAEAQAGGDRERNSSGDNAVARRTFLFLRQTTPASWSMSPLHSFCQ
jgi:hypothetical protein